MVPGFKKGPSILWTYQVNAFCHSFGVPLRAYGIKNRRKQSPQKWPFWGEIYSQEDLLTIFCHFGHFLGHFLPRTPVNALKITLFGIGTPKLWQKILTYEWTLNLGPPERHCDQDIIPRSSQCFQIRIKCWQWTLLLCNLHVMMQFRNHSTHAISCRTIKYHPIPHTVIREYP